MKAFFIKKPGHGSVMDLPPPVPDRDELLVRVMRCGVCDTDLPAYKGQLKRRSPPVLLGHEFSGVVVEKGESVSQQIRVGDHVVAVPQRYCGMCDACLRGLGSLCEHKKIMGSQAWPGAFAEYICVPEEQVVAIPQNMEFSLAALCEPLAVAIHTLARTNFEIGRNVMIFGAGGIGMLLLKLVVLKGANECIVCDHREYNLSVARNLGATLTIMADGQPIQEKLLSLGWNKSVDIAFVSVSYTGLISQSMNIVDRRGSISIIHGYNKMDIVDFDTSARKEQTIYTSSSPDRDDFEEAIGLLYEYSDAFSGVISQEIGVERLEAVLNSKEEGGIDSVKTIVNFER